MYYNLDLCSNINISKHVENRFYCNINAFKLGNVHSAFGRSKLLVESAGKEDEGTYICLAQNAAGERKAATAVRIRSK